MRALSLDMMTETLAGSTAAQTRVTLARYEEWHNESRDASDSGSVYTWLSCIESTVRASEIDLGIDL
jgi:hypothetical protein